jgi:hypothetical protein
MLEGGVTCVGIFAAFLLSIVVATFFERRRLSRVERTFLIGREELADHEFLRRAGADSREERVFLASRRVMADLCGMKPGLIHPEDTVRALLDLQWDRGFIMDFVFAMEGHMGGKLPLGYPPDEQTFGAYVKILCQYRTSDSEGVGG